MALKKYKPTSPGKRHRKTLVNREITTTKPEKSLIRTLKKHAGRNNKGQLTVRHRGGGSKRLYRMIDFKRDKKGSCTVKSIEYDPYRNAMICLVQFLDGTKKYMIYPKGLKVGDIIENGENVDIKYGNTLPLKNIPTGTEVYNIEIVPGKGAQFCRSAGVKAVLMAKHNRYVTLKMPSGEVRLIHDLCLATIGVVGNELFQNRVKGKAGVNRWLGKRSVVRGAAMNAADHPHGGGEGKAPVGRSGPSTPWGKPANGYVTRNRKKQSNKYIVKSRRARS